MLSVWHGGVVHDTPAVVSTLHDVAMSALEQAVRTPRDMLAQPCWQKQDLGLPMPDSRHAVSACLPLWEHNIRYEEADPEVVGQLQAAYPRFCLHPLVRQLIDRELAPGETGLVFPSRRSAERAARHVQDRGGGLPSLRTLADGRITLVTTAAVDFAKLREYWQHAGEIVSSRGAESHLAGQPDPVTETGARTTVRQRVASFGGCDERDVWLFPSGMAAIAGVWRAIRRLDPERPTAQFGFPYVDTLKIQQRFAPGRHLFFPRGDAADVDELASRLASTPICALFCEVPTNPLLTRPDLPALRRLADRYGFVLVVDDTLSAIVNENVLPWADVGVTSLTKYFSGRGDVLAGSARLNAGLPGASRLRASLKAEFEELLGDADCAVLEANSRDVRERVLAINRTTADLVERLRQHPLVDRVHYPEPSVGVPGRGGLFSVVLRHPERVTPTVYDHLRICKGPNLGTRFTLCCPYTILAHYTELETVEQVGVSRWLMRVSVGLEPLDELWERFREALDAGLGR
ncbi:MAG TPA: cystathionine gamma-synthase [Planctomycetaceae bacterium]|nr:cystathionine gamma-synthase [Planctomycetaceae bacterium]